MVDTDSPEKQALRRAVTIVGGQSALARGLGKKQGHVWDWLNKPTSRLPAELAIPVERLTNGQVTRSELRPDIYPPEDSAGPLAGGGADDARPESPADGASPTANAAA